MDETRKDNMFYQLVVEDTVQATGTLEVVKERKQTLLSAHKSETDRRFWEAKNYKIRRVYYSAIYSGDTLISETYTYLYL